MKELISLAAALVIALSLCMTVRAEEVPDTDPVRKYGDIVFWMEIGDFENWEGADRRS